MKTLLTIVIVSTFTVVFFVASEDLLSIETTEKLILEVNGNSKETNDNEPMSYWLNFYDIPYKVKCDRWIYENAKPNHIYRFKVKRNYWTNKIIRISNIELEYSIKEKTLIW